MDTLPSSSSLVGQRAVRCVLVLDVVESVRLMLADETGFIDRWRRFVRDVQGVLERRPGRLVKSLGDGLLVEFGAVHVAVAAALEIMDRMQANNQMTVGEPILLRMGLHVAELVVDELDVYGAGVNLAARLAGLAGPDEIVVSAQVRDQLCDHVDADVEDMGECYLRHVESPQRAYRIGPPTPRAVWRGFEAGGLAAEALRTTIAVLVPAPTDGLPEAAAMDELLADALSAQLSRIPAVKVVSRLSAVAVGRVPSRAGELLGSAYTVHVEADRASGDAHVSLVHGRSGDVLWEDGVTWPLHEDSGELAERARRLASDIGRAVIHTEVHAALHLPCPTLAGYSLFVAAVNLMHRATRKEFERAGDLLRHLIDRHSRAALPRAWLAQWYVLRLTRGWSADLAIDTAAASQEAARALDLDPECSVGHAMAGFVQCHLRRDLDAALHSFGAAIAVNRSEPLAWLFKSVTHTFKGEGAEAVAASEQALSLSPLDPLAYYYDSLAASAAVADGRYDRAIELGLRSLKGNRTHSSTLRALAMAQALSGRHDDARRSVAELLALEPGFTVSAFLRRSPSALFPVGQRYAEALRLAGVPA